jgi:hypothetical protein
LRCIPEDETNPTINHRMVVIGKIIVDEYGKPTEDKGEDTETCQMTIGGGGPQAAWGAAMAMAAAKNTPTELVSQPVTFMGPVGSNDFSDTEQTLLEHHLQGALDVPPKLVFCETQNLVTPRIRLWHEKTDGYDAIHWLALNDSFGPQGAQTLWSTQPTLHDIQSLLSPPSVNVVHVIIECGNSSPSNGWDHLPFLQNSIRQSLLNNNNNDDIWFSVEPIVHPNSETQLISEEDAYHSYTILQSIIQYYSTDTNNAQKINICISPDETLQTAWMEHSPLNNNESDNLWVSLLQTSESSNVVHSWAIRKGSNGSTIVHWLDEKNRKMEEIDVPAATLQISVDDINPTGAGNAYAAAYVASLSSTATSTSSTLEAACIATGVGAIVCEHSHLPLYSPSTLLRMQQAIQEVRTKISNLIPSNMN